MAEQIQNTNVVDGYTIANTTPVINNQSTQSNTIDGYTIANIEKPKVNTIDGYTLKSSQPQIKTAVREFTAVSYTHLTLPTKA